jgi:hypothetical protein
MSLLFLGDCHARWTALIHAMDAAADAPRPITAVIQVGDFGLFPQFMAVLEDHLRQRPLRLPLHVIDGNHEDHAWLRALGPADLAQWAALGLHLHARGTVATIAGIPVGLLGGALHADRPQHGSTAQGTTNWVSDREADRAAAAFHAARVDLVVTHSCPHSLGIGMRGSPMLEPLVALHVRAKGFNSGPDFDCGEPGLHRLYMRLPKAPRAWVFGHFHTHHEATIAGTTFRCVGSLDGTDRRPRPLGHVLDPVTWTWSTLDL